MLRKFGTKSFSGFMQLKNKAVFQLVGFLFSKNINSFYMIITQNLNRFFFTFTLYSDVNDSFQF